ncbi:uncharacterized protein LOC124500185 [Dermatophagoides farinae]|uniref:uncharacterized protein LOC124500185 n=1 Tax=Dermatophagoides farinae TaxID=6954 RepID=UPI003F61DADA
MEPCKDNMIPKQVEEGDGKMPTKQETDGVDENTVRRDESCVKAMIKRYRTNSATTLTSDSRTIIEYVSDKLKFRGKGCEASFSDKTKKQAELIKRLLEQQKIQPIKQKQSSPRKMQTPSQMMNEKDNSNLEDLSEDFDISMHDNDDAVRNDPLATSKTFANIILAIYMFSTVIPLIIHFSQPRLMYIVIFTNLSILFLIIRWAFSRWFHLEFSIATILNIPVSIAYIVHVYSETPKTTKSTISNILQIMMSDEIEINTTINTKKLSSSSSSKRKSSLQVMSKQRHQKSGSGSGKMGVVIQSQ